MARDASHLLDHEHDRIRVAVEPDFAHPLLVPRLLALSPEAPPRPRPVHRPTFARGELQRFAIHPRQHQGPPGGCVLHDAGHETLLVPLHFVQPGCHGMRCGPEVGSPAKTGRDDTPIAVPPCGGPTVRLDHASGRPRHYAPRARAPEPMVKKRIAIVGGSGFVGRHLVAALTGAGCDTRVFTRRRSRSRSMLVMPTCEIVETNVHVESNLSRHLAGCDTVVNLSGILNQHPGAADSFQGVHADPSRQDRGGVPRESYRTSPAHERAWSEPGRTQRVPAHQVSRRTGSPRGQGRRHRGHELPAERHLRSRRPASSTDLRGCSRYRRSSFLSLARTRDSPRSTSATWCKHS